MCVCVCVCVWYRGSRWQKSAGRGQHVDGVNTRSRDTSEVRKSKEPTHPRLRSLKTLAVCLPQASDDLVQLSAIPSTTILEILDEPRPTYPKRRGIQRLACTSLILYSFFGKKKRRRNLLCEHRG